ncbi:MAG: sodium:solute symporter family protein [Clostridiales Family XIII bacterium]|jgi:SSS family solute:Na+ symporter|nr:sodium:solute symporter family protein [Clostridiales Family XIII bacterium]
MKENTLILLTIFVFTFVPLILAEVARKHSLPTLEDFFIQGRGMPVTMVFFTIYATWVSSFAFLGSASHFFTHGPVYATCFAWNALFAALIYFLSERVWHYGREHGYLSPVDFFGDIYGSKALSLIVAIVMIVYTLPYLQIQLSVGAYLIELATGGVIPWRVSGLLFYLVMIIYLWAGGLRAVAMTDVYYGILIFVSMIFIGFYLAHMAGGVKSIFRFISETSPNSLVVAGDGKDGVILWISMFLITPLGAVMGPSVWLRSYAAKERRTFRILPLLLCLATIEYIGPILSGAAGKILMPQIENTDMLVPNVLLEYASPVLCGILFCGIAAATLSTANSQIHSSAAIYTISIHRRYIHPKASEAHLVSVAKWAVLVISAGAYLTMMRSTSYIIDLGSLGLGGMAQLIVPTVGALMWPRSHPIAAICGLLCGIALTSAALFIPGANASILAMVALFINAGLFILLSRSLTPDRNVSARIASYRASYEKALRHVP